MDIVESDKIFQEYLFGRPQEEARIAKPPSFTAVFPRPLLSARPRPAPSTAALSVQILPPPFLCKFPLAIFAQTMDNSI